MAKDTQITPIGSPNPQSSETVNKSSLEKLSNPVYTTSYLNSAIFSQNDKNGF